MKKSFFNRWLLCLLILPFIFKILTHKTVVQNDTIYIGMMNGWPPYMSINKEGNMEGFDVDVINKLSKTINKKIEIVDLGSLSSLFLALEQNKVHAIMSGLDITQKRKNAYCTTLYRNEKMEKLILISNNPLSKDDLRNDQLKIGIENGTSWEEVLNHYGINNRLYFNSIADLMLQLKEKKIDCIIIDSVQYNRISKLIAFNHISELPIPESFIIEGIGIITKKENKELNEMLSEGINQLFQDGTIAELEKKWNMKD